MYKFFNRIEEKVHQKNKNGILLFVCCWLVYVIVGFARSNYAASISYIVSENIFSKADSGVIAAAFYVFYAVGQLFGGKLVDRYSPYKIISLNIICSLISNVILIFSNQYIVVLLVWSFNGLMQFGIWPGISKIIASDITPQFRQSAGFHISYGLSVGNILSYLCAALLLGRFGWSTMFAASTGMLGLALVLWMLAVKKAPEEPEKVCASYKAYGKKTSEHNTKEMLSIFMKSGLLFSLVPICFTSMLSSGVNVWVPTIMMESYSVSPAWANVQSIVLTILNITGMLVFIPFLKKLYNEMWEKCLLSVLAFIPYLVLQFIGKIPMPLTVVMLALSTMLISLGNALNVSISTRFAGYGYSGTVSGMINAMASLGIVLSSAGYGVIAEHFGWSAVMRLWVVLTVVIVMCFIPIAMRWKKFFGIREV